MTTTTITTPGSGNFTILSDCPAGTVIQAECWGGGSGSSSGSSFGAGGAGGAYASGSYTVTSADVTTGSIAYNVGAGGSGTSASLPNGGGNTTFGIFTNLIGNSTNVGAVVGTPGTLPTNFGTQLSGLTQTVVGFGIDTSLGPSLPYIDIQYNGTTTGTAVNLFSSTVAISPSTQITGSCYIALKANPTGAISSVVFQMNENTWFAYLTTVNGSTTTLSSSLQRYTVTTTPGATAQEANIGLSCVVTNTTSYNFTIRYAGFMINTGAVAGTFQATPGPYIQALGGPPPNGTSGGTGSWFNSVLGVGTTYNHGGNGAAYNAAGAGGGGSGGKDGVGANGTTAGVGGKGDGASGGTGGAVSSTTPGNPGTANTEGGGGGGATTQASGTPVGGSGGAPGGGGGSATLAAGTGGTGGNGQLRLSYASNATLSSNTIFILP
jgi:hypothetical protein